MPHHTPLITTLVAGIGLAFLLGALAARIRVPPLVGYLLAGIFIGPFTPGFVADQSLAPQLAEIGIILLMFGVGLHFSLKDLLSVSTIAVPGAIVQIAVATALGLGVAVLMGWTIPGGLVFGLALSVASTVVLLRALQERRLVDTERGRIAVGWLVVEDLAMILTLVLLPAFASLLNGGQTAAQPDWLAAKLGLGLGGLLGLTLAKVAAFIALMLIVGRRVIPWLLHVIAHMGSRELFRLAVLAIALGVAYGAATLFGVSLALGAFFAGMVLSESELSHRAAEESLPLRDAFAVLFFVSVGMLFDPISLLNDPLPVLATLTIIIVGKFAAAFVIVRAFRHPVGTALTISASLAQIGEFSFILADLGIKLELLPERARALIMAGAILSILVNPLIFALGHWFNLRLERRAAAAAGPGAGDGRPATPQREEETLRPTELTGHVVLVGFGQVGIMVSKTLKARELPFLVIEEANETANRMRETGMEIIVGNATKPEVLKAANLPQACSLVVAIPNVFEAGQVVAQARAANPSLNIIARANSDPEVAHLTGLGANAVVVGKREVARGIGELLPPGEAKAEAGA